MRERRALALVCIASAVAACDPCKGYDGLDIIDTTGTLSELELYALEQRTLDFLDWTPSEGLCLDALEVVEGDGGRGSLWREDGVLVAKHPAGADPYSDLYWLLCGALDWQADLSSHAPELFEGDREERAYAFAELCRYGPPDTEWQQQAEAACGIDEPSAETRFLDELVYPGAQPPYDGPLGLTPGPGLRLEGIFEDHWSWGYAVAAGDDIAIVVRNSVKWGWRVVLAEPETGVWEVIWSAPAPTVDWVGLSGGTQAVFTVDHADAKSTFVVDPQSWAIDEIAPEVRPPSHGHVSDGWLYFRPSTASWLSGGAIQAIELATGAARSIPLPRIGPDPLVAMDNGMAPAPGGVVIQVIQAEVEWDAPDAVTIGAYEQGLYRYHADNDVFELLHEDLWLDPLGASADGQVIGRLWQGPAELLGGLDVASHELRVSDEICFDEGTAEPTVVVGGVLWWLEEVGEDVVGRSELFGG